MPGQEERRRIHFGEPKLPDELASLSGLPFTGIVISERPDGSPESES